MAGLFVLIMLIVNTALFSIANYWILEKLKEIVIQGNTQWNRDRYYLTTLYDYLTSTEGFKEYMRNKNKPTEDEQNPQN